MVHIPKAENRPGIYTICHLPSNSVYVGQANKVVSRWSQHLKCGISSHLHIQLHST